MLLRSLAYIVFKVFFKTISISGIPHTGKGSLWIANHTSGIVDPCVLIGLAPVRLRPLAKHTLWNIPAMRLFLKLSKAIPVKRVKDISVFEEQFREERHRDMFSETTKALLSGSNILIFPEGLSHDEPHIFRLKNGVARMALQALNASKNSKVSIVIQPVAIDYSEKDEFRSDLCIHYCEPVTVSSQDFQIKDIMLGVRESLEKNLATFFSWDEKRNWRFLFELAYERTPLSSREFRVFVEKHREGFDNSPDI